MLNIHNDFIPPYRVTDETDWNDPRLQKAIRDLVVSISDHYDDVVEENIRLASAGSPFDMLGMDLAELESALGIDRLGLDKPEDIPES